MSTAIRFYRDQTHNPRVKGDQQHIALAGYLESDLQDAAAIDSMLDTLKSAAGEQQLSGDSYSVTLKGDEVNLKSLNEEEEDRFTLPTQQFQQLLTAWADFLNNKNLISFVPDF